MAKLCQTQLKSRLRHDYSTIQRMQCDWIKAVAYPSLLAAQNDRNRIGSASDKANARVYLVGYRMPILLSPNRKADGVAVIFDLTRRGNYPFSSPAVTAAKPIPFSHRVSRTTGDICIGAWWHAAKGQMLLAQLIIHVARLLNFDEPSRGKAKDAMNYEALKYWKEHLRGRPLTPELEYPIMPHDLTHGIVRQRPSKSAGKTFRIKNRELANLRPILQAKGDWT